MGIEFKVDVLQANSLMGPLAENDEYLMAFGIVDHRRKRCKRPLQAWRNGLKSAYNLNPAEVAVLFGTSMRYDVAQLADPRI